MGVKKQSLNYLRHPDVIALLVFVCAGGPHGRRLQEIEDSTLLCEDVLAVVPALVEDGVFKHDFKNKRVTMSPRGNFVLPQLMRRKTTEA